MKLQDLKPDKGSKKKKTRVGRGKAAGGGTYAGRGIKGQGARGRRKKKSYFEGGQLPLVRRLPFKRGFTNVSRIEYQEVNLDMLNARFESGAEVNAETLVEAGLLRDADMPFVVLGRGELDEGKSLTVKAHRISKSAQEAIEGAGGSYEKLDLVLKGIYATIRKPKKEQVEKMRQDKLGN